MEIPQKDTSVETNLQQGSFVRGGRPNWQGPSEHAFDMAVEQGNFRRAQVIINNLLNHEHESIDALVANKVFALALKEIALPMYYRAMVEQEGDTFEDIDHDISSMYANTTNLMSYLKHEITKLREAGASMTESGFSTLQRCKGALSEATVFALLSRPLKGTDDDPYIVMPASMREDRGQVNNGVRTGVDFKIIDRATQSVIPIQVKTSKDGVNLSRYEEGIVMLSLQQLAHPFSITQLQDSLIAEVEALSSPEHEEILEYVSRKLSAKLERRFERINPSILGRVTLDHSTPNATSA